MQAARLNAPGSLSLLVEEIERPGPGQGELLVQVHAAGVTPSELLWYPTTHTKEGELRRNAIPGHEFSGVVAAVGGEESGISVGDEIYGMNDWFAEGATAEFCLTTSAMIAPKPRSLTHTEAATVPISALTAWQGLFSRARLEAGERLLVHGGAGAVGSFVIQLAKQNGAEVIATSSSRDLPFVRSLGADLAIDYTAAPFESEISEIDVVFDCVGGDTLQRSWKLLRNGGRAVTIAAASEGTRDERTQKVFFIVEPNGAQLRQISDLLETRTLLTFVAGEVPLRDAPAAFRGEIGRHRTHGKVVVVPGDANTAPTPEK